MTSSYNVFTVATDNSPASANNGACFDPVNNLVYFALKSSNTMISMSLATLTKKTLSFTGVTVSAPAACLTDNSGNLYIGQGSNVFKLTYPAMTTAVGVIGGTNNGNLVDGTGTSAVFNQVFGLTWSNAAQSLMFVSDYFNSFVRQFTVSTTTTTSWKFSATQPKGIVMDSTLTYLYVVSGVSALYKVLVSAPSTPPTPLASASGLGYFDGIVTSALYNHPCGLTIDESNNLYMADQTNAVIRQITSTNAYTFAGTGSIGHVDGSARTATFGFPSGIVYVGSNTWFITDNNYIRCIGTCK